MSRYKRDIGTPTFFLFLSLYRSLLLVHAFAQPMNQPTLSFGPVVGLGHQKVTDSDGHIRANHTIVLFPQGICLVHTDYY